DYQARVMQARAMLKSAEAQTGVSRNAAAAAAQNAMASSLNSSALKASIESANARQAKAVKDLDRLKGMFAKGAATQQALDAALAELQSADAQVQMTTRQYEASLQQKGSVHSSAKSQQEQIGISNASVEQRLAELRLAESQLEHTVIVAPFDGIVSKKTVETGQYLQASQPVCSEVESDELWVTA
ncbi:MAG: HlyD family secretion protein, partial [Bacteroidota bacterium]